jgi:primary-amine oxidase
MLLLLAFMVRINYGQSSLTHTVVLVLKCIFRLWKHVEYRNRHNESRRNRELILSSIATVVNYEYCFYWKFKLDGTIEYEIRLTGELSTNLLSAGEAVPTHGTLVAPGVNSQIHQHMFCAKLDMAVDGAINTVSEVDVVPQASPYGNAFVAIETPLRREQDAVRTCDMTRARAWKIANAEGKVNPITKKPVAYKLVPFSTGASMPTMLTNDAALVTKKGAFATANLWVTPKDPKERYPAGEYTPQQMKQDGLPIWIQKKRSIEKEKVVVWHAFGVTHMPRVEDFPVMPCEMTGFSLKPDGFNLGNPAIDLPPETVGKSALAKGCCAK